MEWQEPVALGIVVLTAGLMLASRLRTRSRARFPGASRSCGCACPGAPAAAPPPQITYRARRGQRPRVIIRECR